MIAVKLFVYIQAYETCHVPQNLAIYHPRNIMARKFLSPNFNLISDCSEVH